ncbi:L-rhamnose isomerase [Acetivibrio sp. MSJd-27]|jgi:L-rhamnose isomerase|uniref:L-rhamnose isomerase n=1 Tax=Acetivibrio sp. MSJd-27 TaxID=2841523 RepID=UPI0015AA3444|nr:L-rhamnose isomerase [Acetivibrio sp. MSJd-27]MBU5451057.1 L-rhamnose isomerase [Acetivibrio sp. MSJd-27]
MSNVEKNYEIAKEMYAKIGVDTDKVLKTMKETPISIHCWQIDDLTGFENPNAVLSGGIQATGNAPGKPKNKQEYIENLNKALDLIPGAKKLALHAVYLENNGKKIERDEILPEHFKGWVDYAKDKKIGLDFNPTYFSHPLAEDGFTLSSKDEHVRKFWIEHGKRCRDIGEYFGKELGQKCITNHWIPDGYKDNTIDKMAPRLRLIDSLDQIFEKKMDWNHNTDSVESKLFGIGSESYVTGSHEFYTNYVTEKKNCILCMDVGHFHPTETVSSKISSYLAFGQELMLHVSRPVRWDSDHVVILDDETKALMAEIVRYDALDKVNIGTDFFDASINRIAATAIGGRNAKKALMLGLLEPTKELIKVEAEDNLTKRLALYEETKSMPFGLVWDMFCEMENVPKSDWINTF